MNKSESNEMAKKVLVGAGIVAGAALAAYLLTTPEDRKEAAKKIKSWMVDMKKDVAEKVKEVQHLTEDKYNEIVDEVTPRYKALKDVSEDELDSFTKEMKSHWKNVAKVAKKVSKK